MGLDICVHKMVKLPEIRSKNKDIEDLESWKKKQYKDEDIQKIIEKSKGKINDYPTVLDDETWEIFKDKIPQGYVFDYLQQQYDFKSYFLHKGLNFDEYHWISTTYDEKDNQVFEFSNKSTDEILEFPPPKNTDKIKKGIIQITDKDLEKYIVLVPVHAFLYEEKEYGYMRKGANEQFYDDEMWDKYCYVFDKKTLHEHMMKYFDDKSLYYSGQDSCRTIFQKQIYDKFKDNCGMFVVYC